VRAALGRLTTSLSRVEDVADEMATRLLTSTPAERLRDDTVRCSCTVIISGFFETFLKEVAQRYVEAVSARRLPYADLPKDVQSRHYLDGGILIGQKAKGSSRVSWISADHLDMAKRLASPAGNPSKYTLMWEAYADTRGNPGPEVIDKYLLGLGVDNRGPRLDAELRGSWSAKRLALEGFIALRNEAAHTGAILAVPSPQDLGDFCLLVREIANAIVGVLEVRLGEHPFGINLNTAPLLDIQKLPGVGVARANALLHHRTTAGPIRDLSHLTSVRGFSAALVQRLRSFAHV
jgi:hypothetical protein